MLLHLWQDIKHVEQLSSSYNLHQEFLPLLLNSIPVLLLLNQQNQENGRLNLIFPGTNRTQNSSPYKYTRVKR